MSERLAVSLCLGFLTHTASIPRKATPHPTNQPEHSTEVSKAHCHVDHGVIGEVSENVDLEKLLRDLCEAVKEN
jgi:hypothetical protein